MVKLLEFLDRHTARHLFRSSHLKRRIIPLGWSLLHFSITAACLRVVGIVDSGLSSYSSHTLAPYLEQKWFERFLSRIVTWQQLSDAVFENKQISAQTSNI